MINPTEPFPNIPLLRKAVEWAEAEAAKTDGTGLWDQRWYSRPTACGTAFCIAGWAVMAAVPEAELVRDGDDIRINGEWCHPGDVGQEVLGLTDHEAHALFADVNTITQVRRAAERIAARAGERL